ncbi:polysaccharide deacetylase family protein [Paenibacillus sp. AD87]|uniref:polysaccharide deacetylase family protein n=1 Tax=Paenibacillus sp. AD87 TaxID=1528787 RepID=UPI0007FE57EA|nr:polysaccharide deacetylase family protein [Paenibacillus sp. AD87]OAX47165.1 Peptidoglycan-N-acetylglucosamine deacetylase [Paenibacillus sp. AD87]
MRVQQQRAGESGGIPHRTSRTKTHGRRKIRYGRLSAALALLALLIIGLTYAFIGMTHWIKDYVAPPPVAAIEQPTKLGMIEMTPESKEEPARFQGQVRKLAYITFDDGPSVYTDQLLDILKQHDAKATFFMIGRQLNQHKEAVERLVKEGSYPGLHSMTHNYNKLYKSGSSSNFVKEFKKEQKMVLDLIGFTPHLIRAPYGSSPQIGEDFRGDIAAAGFKLWDWTTDSLDWNLPGQPDKIVERVSSSVHRDKEVILMHEREQTVQALPRILKLLEDRGYEFEVYDPNAHWVSNFSADTRL